MPTTPKTPKSERASRHKAEKRVGAMTLPTFFGEKGPLAELLPGYEARQEQMQVAEAIEQAMIAGNTSDVIKQM